MNYYVFCLVYFGMQYCDCTEQWKPSDAFYAKGRDTRIGKMIQMMINRQNCYYKVFLIPTVQYKNEEKC